MDIIKSRPYSVTSFVFNDSKTQCGKENIYKALFKESISSLKLIISFRNKTMYNEEYMNIS